MADGLRVQNLTAGYGDSVVLEDCSFELREGESLALLGRNGAGKSTLLASLMGQTRVHAGAVYWGSAAVTPLACHRRAAAGLGWVPQERDVFRTLTVEENLTVAARPGRWSLPAIYRMFPRLRERRRHWGWQLSGGEQQMLAMGRALMLNPRLLLLDEPLEGLAPVIVDELCAALQRMRSEHGQSLLLVEQHVDQALALTSQCLVLERGRIVHAAASAVQRADIAALDRWLGMRVRGGVSAGGTAA